MNQIAAEVSPEDFVTVWATARVEDQDLRHVQDEVFRFTGAFLSSRRLLETANAYRGMGVKLQPLADLALIRDEFVPLR